MKYLLHGKDDFSIRERLVVMKEAVGIPDVRDVNITVLDGKQITFDKLIANANTVPFLAEKRLVIVEGLLGKFERKNRNSEEELSDTSEWGGLPEALETLPATTDLVFVEFVEDKKNATSPANARNPIFKLVKTHVENERFEPPPPKQLGQWIVNRAQAEGIEIDNRAAHTMASSIGSNLSVIVSELRKLALYAHERTISNDDVIGLVAYAQEASIFATADAVVDGRSDVAIKLVNQLLHDGSSPHAILSMMARQSRLLIIAKELKAQSASNDEKSKRLGVSGWVLNKTLGQAERVSSSRLIQIHGALLNADHLMKTGSTNAGLTARQDEELVLDTTIVEIASLPNTRDS